MKNKVKDIYKQLKEGSLNKKDALLQLKKIATDSSKKNEDRDSLLVKAKNQLSHLLNLPLNEIDSSLPLEEIGMEVVHQDHFIHYLSDNLNIQVDFPELILQQSLEDLLKTDTINIGRYDEKNVTSNDSLSLRDVEVYLSKHLSKLLKMPAEKINPKLPLEKYGIDSVMVMNLTNELEKDFGSLPKTLFFEFQTLKELSDYFLNNYSEILNDALAVSTNPLPQEVKETFISNGSTSDELDVTLPMVDDINKTSQSYKSSDIAIVGLAGRYPNAETLDQFWNNLSEGVDSISEVPKDRWEHDQFFNEDKNALGKTYGKWGGFIKGMDEFDPLFFSISPLEAEILDPQERIFLQCAYHTLEDACYTREELNRRHGGKIGVFVGVMYEEYQLYGAQETLEGKGLSLGGSPSSIANRVSYFCNFSGPSMAVDTMCSSSVTAIHLACQSIRNGECEAAIAGGVNLSVHPNKYLMLAQGRYMASNGRCESFGVGGDGYVPGEGVGSTLLKRMEDAIRDKDRIYGVIKGTSINHGGKTNGYSVPNPNAQSEVIHAALVHSDVDVNHISYIEAHGTGTSLGDPIEITGLEKAYSRLKKDKRPIQIGSVKSNIGHLESAAGMAGLTKILMQFKHQRLIPSLHSNELNSFIDFKNSVFHVQQINEEWTRLNLNNTEIPLLAGLSSFGAGGSNSHLIVEEYRVNRIDEQKNKKEYLLVFSARKEKLLKQLVQSWIQFLKDNDSIHMGDVEQLLQIGREKFNYRIAILATSKKELLLNLNGYLSGSKSDKVKQGLVSLNSDEYDYDKELQLEKTLKSTIATNNLAEIAELWCNGVDIEWKNLNDQAEYQKFSAPFYPFEKKSYWAPKQKASYGKTNEKVTTTLYQQHPLVHQNISDSEGFKFKSTFRGDEFFLKDHVINGKIILPAAAYVEMVGYTYQKYLAKDEFTPFKILNMVWVQPFVYSTENSDVIIGLKENSSGSLHFKIYSLSSSGETLHAQGVIGEEKLTPVHERIIPEMGRSINTTEIYKAYSKHGFAYGDSFQGIKELRVGNNAVVSNIETEKETSISVNPALLDSAFQSSIGLLWESSSKELLLPFAIDDIQVYKPLGNKIVSNLWKQSETKLDIDLTNNKDELLLRVRGFTSRSKEGNGSPNREESKSNLVYLSKEWCREEVVINPELLNEKLLLISSNHKWTEWAMSYAPKHVAMDLHNHTVDDVVSQIKDNEFKQILYVPDSNPIDVTQYGVTKNRVDEELIKFFNLIKAIMVLDIRSLNIKIVTSHGATLSKMETVNPVHSSLHGFAGSFAKEQPGWKIDVIDIEGNIDRNEFKKVISIDTPISGNAIIYRDGKAYSYSLMQNDLASPNEVQVYKEQGVYVVIGGAGGIGEHLSEHLIKGYSAQVVWIGRRPIDAQIQKKIDRLSDFGKAPLYISADAGDLNSMQEAYAEIKKQFDSIHGIVHSALVLKDSVVSNMDEKTFRSSLEAKTNVCLTIASVFKDEPLDLVLFFSSLVSYSNNPGQSNYAAGCAFKDSFAQALDNALPGHVKVVNWGYWGNIGIVASDEYRVRMEKAGIGSIEIDDGMEAIKKIVSSQSIGLGVMKYLPGAIKHGVEEKEKMVFAQGNSSVDFAVPLSKIDKKENTVKELHQKALSIYTELDEVLLELLFVQLNKVKTFDSNTFTLPQLNNDLGLSDLQIKWLKESLRLLVDGGYIVTKDFKSFTKSKSISKNENELWEKLELIKNKYNDSENVLAQINLVRTTLEALPDIISNKIPSTDVIFPNGAMTLVEGIYKQNDISDHFNKALGDTLDLYIQNELDENPNKKIRILEIGAGTGGTSALLFKRLQKYGNSIGEYCYTDLSRAFLAHAKEHYGKDNPYLTYKIFDASISPDDQEIDTGSFDVVVATNVLHATANIETTLIHSKKTLRKNGILLLNEISLNSMFSHLTFGLLDGWWLYEDDALRITGCPGLYPENWKKVLYQVGFHGVYFPADNAHDLGQQIIAAQSDGRLRVAMDQVHKEETKVQSVTPSKKNEMKALVSKVAVDDLNQIKSILRECVAEALKMDEDEVVDEISFSDIGVDSIVAVNLINIINDKLGLVLKTTVVFDYNNVNKLAEMLRDKHSSELPKALTITEKVVEVKQTSIENVAEEKTSETLSSVGHYNAIDLDAELSSILLEAVSSSLKMDEEEVDSNQAFSDIGVDSIVAVNLINTINERLNLNLQTTVVFDYNNIAKLKKYLLSNFEKECSSVLMKEVLKEPSVLKATSQPQGRNEAILQPAPVETVAQVPIDLSRKAGYRVLIEKPGTIEDLKIVEADIAPLKQDEVRIAVKAFCMNFGDLLCVRGLYPTMPPYPFTPGFEASGLVVEVGSDVVEHQVGDEVVVGMGEDLGGQATVLTSKENRVFPKPDILSFEEACSLPTIALTMVDAFRKARLKKGEKILIQTATGGTGLIAVQMAKHYGAEIIATAGSQHKLDYLKDLGVDHAINYLENDFDVEVMKYTEGYGVDVVINTLSGDAIQKGLNILAPHGRYIEIAMTALKSAKAIDISVLSNNQSLYSVDLRKISLSDPELMDDYRREMLGLIENKVISAVISDSVPFNQIKKAYYNLDDRRNIGKVVVHVPDELMFKNQHESPSSEFVPESVAVIGMSGRFAGVDNLDEYWNALKDGVDLTQEVSRWDLTEAYKELEGSNRRYCTRGGFLKDIESFDALFFNISGVEATYMDPQQRIILEESYIALESAGYVGDDMDGKKCGVYLGSASGDYQQLFEGERPAQAFWGNTGSVIPARISYFLNLQGPAVAIDTACSSSLVAIHNAVKSIQYNEVDMALAGGVFIQSTPWFYVSSNRAGMLSPTGKTYAFDDRADGFVPGEGAGVLVLKKLSTAQKDGDNILGVIRASATNQDGASNGITAPSALSQERLQKDLFKEYKINPKSIQMIECHGTGTKLGDPIEFQALCDAYKGVKNNSVALGSVKTNIGHAAQAAGVASVIKILMSLKHKVIPPSLNYEKTNTNIDIENSPFHVNTKAKEWDTVQGKRRAAVSSFGFSGTNAHLILEEYQSEKKQNHSKGPFVFAFSAKTREQLEKYKKNLIAFLKNGTDLSIGDICYTLFKGKKLFKHRIAFTTISVDHALDVLTGKNLNTTLWISSNEEQKVKRNKSSNTEHIELQKKLIGNRDDAVLDKICQYLVSGFNFKARDLFDLNKHSNIVLPHYPFEREKYWVESSTNNAPVLSSKNLVRGRSDESVFLFPSWNKVHFDRTDAEVETGKSWVIKNDFFESDLEKKIKPHFIINIHDEMNDDKIQHVFSPLENSDELFFLFQEDQPKGHSISDLTKSIFTIIKHLLKSGFDKKSLFINLVTSNAFDMGTERGLNYTLSTLHGLLGSIAKELTNWNFKLLDVSRMSNEFFDCNPKAIPYSNTGESFLFQFNEWFKKELIPLDNVRDGFDNHLYKDQGVYLVVGGSGGVGTAWSKYMIEYFNAKVIWLGRSSHNDRIKNKIRECAKGVNQPEYIQVDVSDTEALKVARSQILKQYQKINGIVHSAIVLNDKSIVNMQEEDLAIVLNAKVDTSFAIAEVFSGEEMDFILFFSSLMSFARAAGQSNYSAACVFKDEFANNLRCKWNCKVKVMNWGYWGNTGIVSDSSYKEKMAKMGIGSIDADNGMKALHYLMNHEFDQLAFLVSTAKNSSLETFGKVKQKSSNITPDDFITDTLFEKEHADITNELKSYSEELNRISMDFVHSIISSSTQNRDSSLDLISPLSDTSIDEKYGRWLQESLRLLCEFGLWEQKEGRYRVVLESKNQDSLWQEWHAFKNKFMGDDSKAAQLNLLEVTLSALTDILSHNKPATDVMFPSSSLKLVEGIYKYNPVADFYNTVLVHSLTEGMKALTKDRSLNSKLRILEVGAGTGGTSALVLKALHPFADWIEEYCYTDLSPAFLNHAEREFKATSPFLNPRILDISNSPAEQGFDVGEYDIIIAANVLHATSNIRLTMQHCQSLLKENGFIFLNELSGSAIFTHLTFGLLDGWWLYEDEKLRIPGCPGLSSKGWQHVLETSGYKEISFPEKYSHNLGQQIIIASSDAILMHRGETKVNRSETLQIHKEAVENKPLKAHQNRGDLKKKIIEALTVMVSNALKISLDKIMRDEAFSDYGVDSVTGVELINKINGEYGLELETTALYEYSTIELLSEYIAEHSRDVDIDPVQENTNNKASKENVTSKDYDKEALLKKLSSHIKTIVAQSLKVGENKIDDTDSFSDYGVDSIIAVNIANELSQNLNVPLESTTLYDYSSIDALSIFLVENYEGRAQSIVTIAPEAVTDISIPKEVESSKTTVTPNDLKEYSIGNKPSSKNPSIAIVGMSGRFASAKNLDELWEYLANGDDLVKEIERWDMRDAYKNLDSNKKHCTRGGLLETIDEFDPAFFKISEMEARFMDPQQRIFLEEAWKALEDAGYAIKSGNGLDCGIYVGYNGGDYAALLEGELPPQALWGNAASVIPARMAYYLNLQGPAITVDTACSSSLVSVHLACQSLWNNETKMALAGGVAVHCTPGFYISANRSGMLSPNGKCHTFDQNADGFVPGEGAGVVVLKRLEDAQRDGDHIYGVILGSGLNQDGKTNGITAPSARSQERLENYVYDTYDINPESIQLIEAHGTGTILGDPIEVGALTKTFGKYTDKKGFCALGSIKSNIGHATAAAGVAGLLKVLLSFKHKQILPTIHYQKANPNIEFESSPFYVSTDLKNWDVNTTQRRRAAISAFGFSGTNAHMVLEEAPETQGNPSKPTLPKHVFKNGKYWIPERNRKKTESNVQFAGAVQLHPLLQYNTSTLYGQQYSSEFTGKENFLKDHVIDGGRVLPGVAYLEMALQAYLNASKSSLNESNIALQNVAWINPIYCNDKVGVDIVLDLISENEIGFNIKESKSTKKENAKGIIRSIENSLKGKRDFVSIRGRCNEIEIDKKGCYNTFEGLGFSYGTTHQCIDRIHSGHKELMVSLSANHFNDKEFGQYIMYPGLLDSVLQAMIGIGLEEGKKADVLIPFSIDNLEVYGSIPKNAFAHVTWKEPQNDVLKIDITLCDQDGNIILLIEGFNTRKLQSNVQPSEADILFGEFVPSEISTELDSFYTDLSNHSLFYLGNSLDVKAIEQKINLKEIVELNHDINHVVSFNHLIPELLEFFKSKVKNGKRSSVIVLVESSRDEHLLGALDGFIKTLCQEHSHLDARLLSVNGNNGVEQIITAMGALVTRQIPCAYLAEEKLRRTVFKEKIMTFDNPVPWKERAVYWITGGAGGVGRQIVLDIIDKVTEADIVLTGRREIDTEIQEFISKHSKGKRRIHYYSVDISNREDVMTFKSELEERFPMITGIIHGAGGIRDSVFMKKTAEAFQEVLAPKIEGAVFIDEISKDWKLDFMIYLSAGAAVFGNPGQSDYAMGNSFMDHYCDYRNQLVDGNLRQGRTFSINWPLWKEGGMKVDPKLEKRLYQSSGMKAMETHVGLNTIYSCLHLNMARVLVIQGNRSKLKKALESSGLVESNSGGKSNYDKLFNEIESGNISEEDFEKLVMEVDA